MSALLLLCVWMLSLGRDVVAQDRTYLITSPRLVRLDAVETVVVQVFDEQDATVQLHLKKSLAAGDTQYATETVQLNAENSYQAAANMRIVSKDFPSDVTHVYLHAVGSGINQHERMPISRDNGLLFIQTDKPLYTPEQSVKVRVFSLSEELKPARRKVTLTFRDPDAVKVDIVDLEDVSGIISMLHPFKIPLKPKFGVWKIEASYTDDFSTTAYAQFEVKEYVLPSIIVTIQPEQRYISQANMDSFKLSVTARYAHGAPVQQAYVMSRFGYISGESTVILPRTSRTVELTDGQTELNLNITQALADAKDGPKDLPQLEGTHLYVMITVEETTGGVRQQAELATVKFVASPFSLSLIATPLFIKPALPYTVRAVVRGPMGDPVSGVPVKIQASVTNGNGQQDVLLYSNTERDATQVSDSDGVARFTYNIPSTSVRAQFVMETVDKKLPSESQAAFKFKADTYVSTRGRYLSITSSQQYLTLKSFSYQVLSKGRVVKQATQPRRGTSTEFINLKVTPDMVPSARLIVYYVQSGEGAAELVADSVWFDVQDKCMNGLKVALSVPSPQYEPKEELALQLKSSQSSVVALASVDTALHSLRLKHTDPLSTVLRHVERKDMGCGGGGGRDAADVFRRAGLIFMTNANAKTVIEGDTCSDVVRPKRELKKEHCDQMIQRFPALKRYCVEGSKQLPTLESCEARVSRLGFAHRQLAREAFLCCCKVALQLMNRPGVVTLARSEMEALFEDSLPMQIRSYFPESWLWEEHQVPEGTTVLRRMLPDSLTTWEMRAIGLSNDGVCVSEPLRVSVSQAVSVDVPLPYTMVRGEQIELKGSIYNQHDQESWFSLTLDASEGICVFRGQNSEEKNKGVLDKHSVHFVHFYIMALEAGTHTLNFTLGTRWGRERLVKILRVTPEGILTEDNTGATIDPQGIYGSAKRKVELRNSFPPKVVPNSPVERRLTLTGELLGEVLAIMNDPKGLQQLVNLPRGSAEKELMGLLPLYYVYHYMEMGSHWAGLGPQAADIKADLKNKMKEGLISIMSFKTRVNDAFSMWKDREASTWLTALMVKTLAEVNKYTAVDGNDVSKCIYWLVNSCQKADGSFLETSNYKPIKLMGAGADTTEQAAYLTSFVIIGIKNAMAEVPECNLQLYSESLKKAESFLFDSVQSGKLKSLYVRAVTAYALSLLDSSSIPSVTLYEGLQAAASVKGNPPVVRFWQEDSSAANPLKPHKASAQTVETTVYVLLTALLRGHASHVKPILTWLTQDQRYGGGFYSTQDTILTLEALAKYSIMTKDAILNMGIKAAYRTKGDLDFITLTDSRPVGKPITVTKNDDIILSTGLSTGVSVANLKTVYYKMVEDSDTCHFDISIDMKPRNPRSNNYMELLPRIIACARYKPSENEVYTEASHTVMEIQLPTGVNPLQEDLDTMQNGLETLISDYEIDGDKVIIQLDSGVQSVVSSMAYSNSPQRPGCTVTVPSVHKGTAIVLQRSGHSNGPADLPRVPSAASIPRDPLPRANTGHQRPGSNHATQACQPPRYANHANHDPGMPTTTQCVGLVWSCLCLSQRAVLMIMSVVCWFSVELCLSPTESSCSKVYHPQERKLLRLCEKEQCHCMAAECCTFRSTLDTDQINADSLQKDMCKDRVKYAFKVIVESNEAEGDFVTYKAKVQDVFKKGAEDVKIGSEVEFVKKATCSSTRVEAGQQYLVMGAEIMQIRQHRSYRYKFPLDSQAQVDIWPDRATCKERACTNYLRELDNFTDNILIDGC
ncbi:complement C5 [Alosa alosa]|uniref:complement C5 n=1 Tax=Alosa alosa TaxID=278164 RepID=UPI0020153355|nr:complement C5 [Alosa alosa]